MKKQYPIFIIVWKIEEVHALLSLHYVEDDHAVLRFKYSTEFLQWALMPPGYCEKWNVGVRISSNNKLVAFISGVPLRLRIRKHQLPVAEINFLCIHKKLRTRRLAPVLIMEIARQVKLQGISQGIYTAGAVLPTPVSVCRYYHRPLNIPKLVDIKFTSVPRGMTVARLRRVNHVPKPYGLPGIREMEDRDAQQVTDLLTRYLRRFELVPEFSVEETKHHFISGKGTGAVGDGGPGRRASQITWTYVIEDPTMHRITDFVSFYSLPSTVINNAKYPVLEAAYLYYYATETAFAEGAEENGELQERLKALLGETLAIANHANFDVVNALTLMDNVAIFPELKFGLGHANLNYYLYNWRMAPVAGANAEAGVAAGKGVGFIML
ncbi:hypothetical protein H0H87_009250 [Tephrocybe sp. NHM501043]|nr:hypothetical protein H0H87_009250 [Tephrocybe sp. NHM501043]